MKNFTILCLAAGLLAFACKDEKKKTEKNHPLYGDSTVTVLPNGDSVIQDKEGNTVRTIYTPFGPSHSNTTITDNPAVIGVERPYYITGRLAGGSGANITLDLLSLETSMKPLYTQVVNKEEQFDFEGRTSVPQMMQMRLPAGQVHFIVKPGDTIHFDLDLQTVTTYGVKGSPESEQLYHIYANILEKANDKKQAIDDEIDKTGNLEQKGQLMATRAARVEVIDQQKFKELRDYITRIGNSYAALAAAMYLRPDEDIEFLSALDDKFARLYPNSELYKALHEKVEAYSPLRIGYKAPEILLPTPEGKDVRLSDLKGKYVLLHFWTSYNTKDIAALKNLYDKYKSRGLDVYAVSLDSDRDIWMKAIKDNKIGSWTHVSDLLAQKSQAVQTYLISNIPSTYLLDRDGRILARDIKPAALEKKLDAIF
jgi:peroxiredoxin